MKYVLTKKLPLMATTYTAEEILHNTFDREFHENYPAPTEFVVDMANFEFEEKRLTSSDIHLLGVWWCRGSKLVFVNDYQKQTLVKATQTKRRRPQWEYSFVDSLPKAYISLNKTTPQAAYDFGKTLINACTKQSKLPIDALEEAYRAIMRCCLQCHIYATSPNEKTWIEAKAELDTVHDIECYFGRIPEVSTNLTDIELNFYARVFDIQMPEWFLRSTAIKTEHHGFAVCPYTDSSNFITLPQLDNNGSVKQYDGNDFDRDIVPMTLVRDSFPQKLSNQKAERALLAEQVVFYLSLPIAEQKLFMTNNYGYCDECGEYFELRDGCHCGANLPMEDDAYMLYNATREFALSEALYREA